METATRKPTIWEEKSQKSLKQPVGLGLSGETQNEETAHVQMRCTSKEKKNNARSQVASVISPSPQKGTYWGVPPQPIAAHPPPTDASGANTPLSIPTGSSFQACTFIFHRCKPVHFLQLIFFFQQCKPVHFPQLTISAVPYLNTADELVRMLKKKKNAPPWQKGAEPCSYEPRAQGSTQLFHVLQKV